MEQLKVFIKGLPDDAARVAFADRCDTSIGHLRNIIYGKPCSAELAALIEAESGGAVRRWHLRPNDWHRIWKELIRAKGAPPVPEPAIEPEPPKPRSKPIEPADSPAASDDYFSRIQAETAARLERAVMRDRRTPASTRHGGTKPNLGGRGER